MFIVKNRTDDPPLLAFSKQRTRNRHTYKPSSYHFFQPAIMAPTSCPGHITVNIGVQAFQNYINHHLGEHFHEGLDVHMKRRQFICKISLISYWTPDKIRQVLTHGGPNLSDDAVLAITSRHIQTFSVLSYIGRPDCIVSFIENGWTDTQLPIPITVPDDFRRSCQDPDSFQAAWRLFSKEQWKFTPLVFETGMHMNKLPSEQILPIRIMTHLPVTTGFQETKIYKVSLQPCCSRLPEDEVIFKCLFKSRGPGHGLSHWEQEAAVRAEMHMAEFLPHSSRETAFSSSLGVIESFGSHVWCTSGDTRLDGDHGPKATSSNSDIWTHFIILEHASGGTLSEFCERNAAMISSSSRQDQFNFWSQMFNILVGITTISRLGM